MALAFFEPAGDGAGGADAAAAAAAFVATTATAGPWSPSAQHGGPPAALLTHLSALAARAHTGRDDLLATRLLLDFLGPAPVGPVQVRTRVLRAGRSAVLVEAELDAAGRTALTARTWLLRRGADASPVRPLAQAAPAPPPEDVDVDDTWDFPYARALEWRPVGGDTAGPGPATAWVRPRVDLLPGVPADGLAAVALVADSGNGLSAELSWDDWSFANVDLAVHLHREPVDGWLLVDARTHLAATGTGTAHTRVHDRRGLVAVGAQTLVVQRTTEEPA